MDYVKARDPAMSMCLEGLFLNMPHAPHTFKDDNFVAQACDGILRSTMLENGGQMEIWVTSKNHQWAAHVTGLTLDEISKKYEDAEAQGLICTLLVPRERQSDVVRITEMYRDRRNPRG